MKRIWKITAVAVVIAVVVIAAFLLMGQKSGTNWHVGDYVEYTWSTGAANSTTGEPNLIQTYTVVSVTNDQVTVNYTEMDASRHYRNSTTFHINPDSPLSRVNSWISDGLPNTYSSTYIGKDVLKTTRGDQNVDRYLWKFNAVPLTTADVWIDNGIVMKKTIHWNDYTHIVTLTDSNVQWPS